MLARPCGEFDRVLPGLPPPRWIERQKEDRRRGRDNKGEVTMRTTTTLTIPLLLFATSAGTAPAKIRLPEPILGLWCYYSSWEGGVSYLRNDASAPKPSTPCTKDGGTEWIVIDADGSYHGLEWGCRAVRVTIIDRGVVIKGQPGANAVYGLDGRCEGEGDTWRERARIEVERWGSALTIIRRKELGSNKGDILTSDIQTRHD
jgi:hypothetical protein